MNTFTHKEHCQLINKKGLHARVAAQIARCVAEHDCNIRLGKTNNALVPADDVLELLTLGAQHQEELILEASGKDADKAIKELKDMFETGFGEIKKT